MNNEEKRSYEELISIEEEEEKRSYEELISNEEEDISKQIFEGWISGV